MLTTDLSYRERMERLLAKLGEGRPIAPEDEWMHDLIRILELIVEKLDDRPIA